MFPLSAKTSRPIALLFAIVLVVLAFGATAVAAQDDEDFVDPFVEAPGTSPELDNINELGPGSCSPASVGIDQATTCTFPLIGATVLPEYALHAAAIGEGDLPWEPTGRSSRCSIADNSLVCRDILLGFDLAEFDVTIPQLILTDDPEPLATVRLDRTVDGILGIVVSVATRVPPTFAGEEIEIDVFRSFAYPVDFPADLVIRREDDGEVVDQVRALEPGEVEGVARLTFPERGRYLVSSCAPNVVSGCDAEGIPYLYEALGSTPIELVAGHNGPPEDRINLVFIGSGFDPVDPMTLPEFAQDILALDGEPVPITDGAGGVWDLGWGPFSIDPLRGNAGKFNFWYLEDQTSASFAFVNGEFEGFDSLNTDVLGLGPNVVPISVSKNGAIDGSRANATLPSFVNDADLPERADVKFGGVFLPVSNFSVDYVVLAHEFGHALFGLRDEYEEAELTFPTLGYPNCVGSDAEAREIWGDLIGELDPMYKRWQTTMTEAGVWFDSSETTAENFTTSVTRGGCFATGSNAAVRPSVQSIMGGSDPVFGAANRRRVEQVLALFPEPSPPTTTTTTTTTSAPVTTAPPTAATAVPSPTSSDDDGTTQLAGDETGSRENGSSSNSVPIALITFGVLLLVGGVGGLLVSLRKSTPAP